MDCVCAERKSAALGHWDIGRVWPLELKDLRCPGRGRSPTPFEPGFPHSVLPCGLGGELTQIPLCWPPAQLRGQQTCDPCPANRCEIRLSILQVPACLTQVPLGEDEANPTTSRVFQVPGRSASYPTVQVPSLSLEPLEDGNSGVHHCHGSFGLVT